VIADQQGLCMYRIATGLLCLALSACASVKAPKTSRVVDVAVSSAKPETPAPSPQTPAATGQPPAFDTVTKGAERVVGLLPIWRKQDKLWLELGSKDWRRAFFLSPQLTAGIGEQGLFGGLLSSRWAEMGRPQWVEFRRVNQQVQLLAINGAFTAEPGTPTALGVEAGFSHSLLASSPVASAEHPERGTVLIDLSALMSADVMGLAAQLQRSFRQNYTLDGRQTAVTQVPASPQALVLQVQQHFMAASVNPAATGNEPTSAATGPKVPSGLPDPRSLFITMRYTLSPLPEQVMPSRMADPRVGYFTSTRTDFTDDLNRSPKQRLINRWSLVRQDATAPRSPPVRPLVFWLDASIPKAYRDVITEGVLEWNKAFEAIGFEQALQVRDNPQQQPVDTVGNGHVVIRWMTNHEPRFGAIGPSHVDPRSGEILAGSIAFESLSSRSIRALKSQILEPQSTAFDSTMLRDGCQHADHAAEQLAYGLNTLDTSGVSADLPPDSAQVQSFVLGYLKETTLHEVGHVLGLRHNFKASRWRTAQQLQNPTLTRLEGNSASVMDYPAINLGPPGEVWGSPFQTTLGPYDYWAIAYGYQNLTGSATAQAQALKTIASRQSQPAWQLALDYATDEDLALGLDPQAMSFDLGQDPLAFAQHRLQLAQTLMAQYSQAPPAAEDAAQLRRRVLYALRDMGRVSGLVLRQVGGLITRRDAPNSARALLEPLPASAQRAALNWLLDDFLSITQTLLPAALQRRLAPDYFERADAFSTGEFTTATTDFSVADQWLALHQPVLDGLMSDKLAARLLDNIDKTSDLEHHPLTWQEVQTRLQHHIWPTNSAWAMSSAWQRNLQRSHVNRLSAALLHGGTRADVRAQYRRMAQQLLKQLIAGSAQHLSEEANAHRLDCIGTIERALKASVIRQAP
jgi:hypothetical protein